MSFRKTLSCILVVLYLVCCLPVYASSGKSDTEFYIAETFDNYATGSTPSFKAVEGKNIYIEEHTKGSDKHLVLKTQKKNAGVTVDFSKSASNFILSFDLGINGPIPQGFVSVKSSSSSVKALIMEQTPNLACLTAYNYKQIGGISEGGSVHLDMFFELESKKYSVYVNGNPALSDWFIKGTVPASASSVSFSFTGTDSECASNIYIDNLYAYSGSKVLSSSKLPKQAYNKDEVEFVETPEIVSGNKVYVNRTYDEVTGAFAQMRVFVSNLNEVAVKEEKNGNKYLNMLRKVDADCLFVTNGPSGGSSKMVVEFDISSDKPGSTNIYFRSTTGVNSTLATLDDSGQLLLNKTLIGKLRKGKWLNVAYTLDFEAKKMSVYADGVVIIKNAAFTNTSALDMSYFRIQLAGTGECNVKIDNLKIYDGDSIRDISNEESEESEESVLKSIVPDYEEIPKKLVGKVALHINGGTLFANGVKSNLDVAAQVVNGRTLVPIRAVSEGFGLDVNWDESTQKVTVGNNIELTIGKNVMKVGSRSVNLDVSPQVIDGRTLVPLRALCEQALGKNVFYDDHGIIIIGDGEIGLDALEVIKASNYMLYDHPTKQEILDIFNITSKGKHPRVGVTKETFENIKAQYEAGGIMKKWGDEVIFKADSYLKQPLPVMDKSVSEQQLLTIPQAIKDRIENLALSYYLTGNNAYVDRVYDELYNAANFPDWNTSHYLNTAEYMTAFAIGYDWLYDCWSEEQKKIISETLYKKGLVNSYDSYYDIGGSNNDSSWTTTHTNWNIVCNGGTICGAVALLDDYPDIAAACISNALLGMDNALLGYYPSGVWTEGLGYWEFATEFVARVSETLNCTFGSDFNITNSVGFDKTYDMPIHVNGYVTKNNYNDSDESKTLFTSPTMFWLANKFNQPGVASVRMNLMKKQGKTSSALDMIYCNTDQLDDKNNFPLDKYLAGDELVTMRTSWEDNSGTYLSFHGGNASVTHGHIDSGTFVIDMLGERIASDLGSESYSHPLYSNYATRYQLYRARAEGHNMVVINPDETEGISLTSFSPIEKMESGKRGVYSVLNLDDAYNIYTSSYRRAYKLEDDRRSAVVRDEFTLLRQSKGYWFMHTSADIEVVDNLSAILTKNGKKFLIRFATNLSDFTLKEMAAEPLPTSPVVDGQTDNASQGFSKLAIEFNASGDVYIEMKAIPLDDPASSLSLTNIPIAQWKLPDGEMQHLPKVDMLYYNGNKIRDFDKYNNSYTINVPKGDSVPVITADLPEDCYYEVVPANNLSEYTLVKVISSKNPSLYRKYYINHREISVEVAQIDGYLRHNVRNIIASDNPQPENMDVNIFDGNLKTRWSAEGAGQWIMLDLGTSQKMNAYGIATYNGSKRTLTYSVEVSDDGENWTNVFLGLTKLTEDIEIVAFPEVSARYVRLTGYGTSTGAWNSITEFATLYSE